MSKAGVDNMRNIDKTMRINSKNSADVAKEAGELTKIIRELKDPEARKIAREGINRQLSESIAEKKEMLEKLFKPATLTRSDRNIEKDR